ncbi:uncharacterized protein DEA37_0011077, partial [Paragonimus westermani]
RRETGLRILGMEKRFHLSSHHHTYVCVLIGPTLNAFFTEYYNCSWRSLIPNASVTHEGSNLIVDSRATLGTHNYECSYDKNGLQLKTKLEFYVTNASEMELKLNFRTNRSLIYNPMKDKEIIIECSAGFLGAMVGERPKWQLITGKQQAHAGDRSHHSEAKSVFYIKNMHIGSNTIRCRLSVYSVCLSKLVIFRIVAVATGLNFMPSTIDLNNEDQFGCFTSSHGKTGVPVLSFPRDINHPGLALLTSDMWQQGEWMSHSSYVYSCILILSNRDPVLIEDLVHITKKPTKLFFRKLGWSWIEGWKCETDGFPVTSADFTVTILDQPMGSHFDITNDTVIVTQFSIFGRVRLSCVLNYQSKSSSLIKRITEDVIFIDTGHVWDGDAEQFTENTNPVYLIVTSVISLLYFIVYRLLWNRVLFASSWFIRSSDEFVEYDVDPPCDAHLLITEAVLGRNDFAYFCDLIGEFDVAQKMCILVLQQEKPKRDSTIDASHPGDPLFQTSLSGVDNSETISESLSFEEGRDVVWNRDPTSQRST